MRAQDNAKDVDAGKVRSSARTPDTATGSPGRAQTAPQALLALQSSRGNAAVVQMLRAAGHPGAREQHQHSDSCGHLGTEDPSVQRSAVHDVLRSPGRPLEEATRTDMEGRFGADFSDVRIHDNTAAKASAAEVGARAYTSGSHVVIGHGGADKHTLAHELTHVLQQRQGPVAGTDNGSGLKVSDPSDRFEREAEANATRVMSRGPALQRAESEASAVPRVGAAAIQRAPEQNRPAITHNNPDDDWVADNTAPARADGLVLSGHGAWHAANGQFRVPAGTRVHFYTQHGMVLPDDLGGNVEQGANQRGSVEQGQRAGASRTIVGGRTLQNYTISYPSGLTIRGNPAIATPVAGGYSVELDPETQQTAVINVASLTDPQLAGHSIVFDGDVLLSDILQPGMGDVHFAACRFVETGRPGTRNQGRPQDHNYVGDPGDPGGLFNP
ncbi:DUF4157 domain-containing protein [Kitasatospora sp. NPDC087314]|uniref:eCIS core domain-containing protein n=1 Tax=Kitasatospora sp. NPDC087314 TaxID=3364068 RepID=UPI0038213A28